MRAGRNRSSMRRAGMARCELLVLLGGGVVLLGLLLPWMWHRERFARTDQVWQDIADLHRAILQVQKDTGNLPLPGAPETGDARFGRLPGLNHPGNRGVVGLLQGEDPAFAGGATYLAPRAFEPGAGGLDASGEFLDPWGTAYQIVLDADRNFNCSIPDSRYGTVIGQSAALWSCGPDRRPGTRDDICSWRAGYDS